MHIEHQTPQILKLISIISKLLTKRIVALIISSLLIVIGYIMDCYLKLSFWLPANASVVTIIGLFLSIKYSYLSKITSLNALVASSNIQSECVGSHEAFKKNPINVVNAIGKAKDTGYGFILTIIGTVISAYGELIPFVF